MNVRAHLPPLLLVAAGCGQAATRSADGRPSLDGATTSTDGLLAADGTAAPDTDSAATADSALLMDEGLTPADGAMATSDGADPMDSGPALDGSGETPADGSVADAMSDAAPPDAPSPSFSCVLPAGPGLGGLLIDPDGEPLPYTAVLACMDWTCFYDDSDEDGCFSFEIEPTERVALKTHADLEATPRRAAALEPIAITDDAMIDVGTLYVPDLPGGTVLGPASDDPQTVDAGDGLMLTLSRADIRVLLGEFLWDVAARALPSERIPPYPDLGEEQVVAVYALHPFGARSDSPMAVRAPSDLPADTPVWFRTVSRIDGTFSDPVAGLADGTEVATDPDLGITALTYLVISR
ncbi:MAG: hypothetical protein AABZ30_15405 [Myxococcota bacterium]